MLTTEPSLLSLLLLSLLFISIAYQLWYHVYFFRSLIKARPKDPDDSVSEKVSVIVCARSEKDNLQKLLPVLFEQDHPGFEVIVVDDASWDGTGAFLEEYQKSESRLKVVTVTEDMKKYYQGKKLALSLGIKAASNEILLLTDADCIPVGRDWIRHMTDPYHLDSNIEIVLGYSPFRKEMNPVNLISRMDNAYTGLQYLSNALKGDPYMGVGRNLSYRRSLFFRNKGFASHLHIAPGDDDLFVNEVATPANTAVCIHPGSFVVTASKTGFADWFAQKRRHNFAGRYYNPKHRRKLGLFIFTHALLWMSFAANAFVPSSFGWALILLGTYWLVKWPLIYYGFRKIRQHGIVIWMPVFDVLYLFYNIVFGFITLFGKQKKW